MTGCKTNVQNSALDGETNAFQQYTVTIRNPSYPDPYQGRDPLSFVSTAPPNLTIGANNLVNAPAKTGTEAANPGVDVGPADNDRRHSFVASGSILLPADVTLGAVWTLRSALPFNATAGKDLNGDGSTSDLVPGTTRNQGNRNLDLTFVNTWRALNGLGPIAASQIQQSHFNRLDIRASKALSLSARRQLELIAQVFNVLGVNNLGGIGTSQVSNALSDSFGRILSAQPKQQAELAIRLVF